MNNVRYSIDVIQMWQGLGALRPAALREIETHIWEALFDIANLKVTNMSEILGSLSQTVNELLKKPGYKLQPSWFGRTGKREAVSRRYRKHAA